MPTEIFDYPDLEFALRLLVAAFCGGVIGVERTRRNKGAGIKTHMLVAVGAALFVILSKYGFLDITYVDGARVDVSRVAASVTTGVGFLGGGIIFLRGNSVQGLTTAASIWITSAIGAAIGVGMYLLGGSATVLIVVLQIILHKRGILGVERTTASRIVVVMKDEPDEFERFRELMEKKDIEIYGGHIKKNKDDTMVYTLDIRMPKDLLPSELLELVRTSGTVKSIGM